jgi:hypothetical protein
VTARARGTVAPKRRVHSKTDVCLTVEAGGVWVYGNREAFRKLAERMALLARSKPAEHYELHVKWHLQSHFSKRKAVFLLLDEPSRSVHSREDFELTFMVAEPADLRRLRRHERSGKLPRKWRED